MAHNNHIATPQQGELLRRMQALVAQYDAGHLLEKEGALVIKALRHANEQRNATTFEEFGDLAAAVEKMDELSDAVDAAHEDIGGSRGCSKIIDDMRPLLVTHA